MNFFNKRKIMNEDENNEDLVKSICADIVKSQEPSNFQPAIFQRTTNFYGTDGFFAHFTSTNLRDRLKARKVKPPPADIDSVVHSLKIIANSSAYEISISKRIMDISSTLVKQNRSYRDVPSQIREYLDKKCETLSENTLSVEFFEHCVKKTFRSSEIALDVALKSQLVNSQQNHTPFVLAKFHAVDGCVVTEENLQNVGTLLDMILKKDTSILNCFCELLEKHLSTTTFTHGDLSVSNILCLKKKDNTDLQQFGLIDYERIELIDSDADRKVLMKKQKLMFYSSISYYLTINGVEL